MKNSLKTLKKLNYLILVLVCITFILQKGNPTFQSTHVDKQEKNNVEWWQVGDFYTYQEINNTDVNVTYTLAEEITYNGTQVFNVTSTVSQRPNSFMWPETYQENNYHTVDSFDRIGSKIHTFVEAIGHHQYYNSVENVSYLDYSQLSKYKEGVNVWTQRTHSERSYEHLWEPSASGPFLWLNKQTDVWLNATVMLESVEVAVPAGIFDCWKIDYPYPASASEWPYFSYVSSEMPLTQNASSIINVTGEGIDWNPDSGDYGSYENSSIYFTKIRNTTRVNDSYTTMDYWFNSNGTISSGTSDDFNDHRKVLFIDKTLGLVLKSVYYYWNSGWEASYGYELSTVYLASPPLTTTTTTSTASSTSSGTTQPTTNATTSTTSSTPFTPLWVLFMILIGFYCKRKLEF